MLINTFICYLKNKKNNKVNIFHMKKIKQDGLIINDLIFTINNQLLKNNLVNICRKTNYKYKI